MFFFYLKKVIINWFSIINFINYGMIKLIGKYLDLIFLIFNDIILLKFEVLRRSEKRVKES